MKHIVILGAGYGGLMTALRLQPQIKQDQAQVTLINASDTFVERIRLHQMALGQDLPTINIPEFLQGTGVVFVQDYVRHINPEEQYVTLDDHVLDYDILVVALGSQVDREAVAGIQEYAHTLDGWSVASLREKLQNGGELLIIGGGLTGIEAATEYAEREDVEVQLVTNREIGAGLSPAGRDHIRNVLNRSGVKVVENVRINAIYENYAESSMGDLSYDACLWAGGFRVSPMIEEAGFLVNESGQMLLRDTLQSLAYDNVYAVGDVGTVAMQNGKHLRMACAVALPMGTHAASNITATLQQEPIKPFRFSFVLQCISLGRNDALVQMVHDDDTPTDRIFTGRFGVFIKEMICRYTIFSLKMDKRFPGKGYYYPQALSAVSVSEPVPQL